MFKLAYIRILQQYAVTLQAATASYLHRQHLDMHAEIMHILTQITEISDMALDDLGDPAEEIK